MSNIEDRDTINYVELTAEVVSAFVMHNSIQRNDIPELIMSVHRSLRTLGQPNAAAVQEKPAPAVPVKKSVTPDYIISLEDGRRYKSLKRHLNGRGLTPEQYRERWSLPHDYPMVAPNYAKQRSELAKSMGLGRQRREEPEAETPVARGRRKKAG